MTLASTEDHGGSGLLDRASRVVLWLERAGSAIAGTAIFVVMVTVFVDVVKRYFFNSPLTFAYDLIGIYLMPIAFFLALSDTFRLNHHIAVDIVYLKLSVPVQRALRLAAAVLSTVVFVPIAQLSVVQAIERLENNDVIAGTIEWPTWIPSAFVAVGFGLLIIRLLVDGIGLAVALASRSSTVPGESFERAHASSPMEEI